jgi:hypothetical protein
MSGAWYVSSPTKTVDFAAPAIVQAQTKAAQAQAQLAQARGSVTFMQADVTRLAPPASSEQNNLLLDIWCLNGIPAALRPAYAQVLTQQATPSALLLLYAHLPRPDGTGPAGCTPDELDALFAATFVLERRVMGQAPQGGASMWNWFRRRP